jgi:hypothetical protein
MNPVSEFTDECMNEADTTQHNTTQFSFEAQHQMCLKTVAYSPIKHLAVKHRTYIDTNKKGR